MRSSVPHIPGYELLERIGQGGTAEVWRAMHCTLRREAAVKLLQKEDAASPLMRARFQLEARAAASLTSPHAVEIYDFGTTENGTLFLVMELLHGLDLQRLVEEFGPQDPGRTAHLLAQACEVLQEAHTHNLIHRDIKPANIFVSPATDLGDFVKVVDFGLVRVIGCDRDEPTTPQNMSGTMAFLPPEVVTAECIGECHVDGRADLYALGCVGYWLLTAETVFEANTPITMAAAHALSQPLAPSARSKQRISRDLDACILDCLAKDPKDRPSTASTLASRLRDLDVSREWTPQRANEWWSAHPALSTGHPLSRADVDT